MTSFPTLASAVAYVQGARRTAHDRSCPPGTYPCAACVPFGAAVTALDIIRAGNAGPSSCRPARLALHDNGCRSGCVGAGRDEHARRHDGAVRELRRYVEGEAS